MKRLMLTLTLCALSVSPAYALTVHFKGKRADAFIAKHFPSASIPGPVEGSFTYGVFHYKRYGRASCNVPAMGARSDGAVSTCTVVY
jgi:hypothetical protein